MITKKFLGVVALFSLSAILLCGCEQKATEKEMATQEDSQEKVELTADNITEYLDIKYTYNTSTKIVPNNVIQARFSDIGFEIYPISGIRFENLILRFGMYSGNNRYTLYEVDKDIKGSVDEEYLEKIEDDVIFYEIEMPTNGTLYDSKEFTVFTTQLVSPDTPFVDFVIDSVSGYVVISE